MADDKDDEPGPYVRITYRGGFQDVPINDCEGIIEKFGTMPGQEVVGFDTLCPNTKTKAKVTAIAGKVHIRRKFISSKSRAKI